VSPPTNGNGNGNGNGKGNGQRSSRDAGTLNSWWIPVSMIVVGDLVYMEPVGLVYEVVSRKNGETPLSFRAKVRREMSAPTMQDVDPSKNEIDLIFVDTSVRFTVLRSSVPPKEYVKSLPA